MIMDNLRTLFKKLNIYYYVKYSGPFRLYERMFKPKVKKQFDDEKKLYHSFLNEPKLIFDIGAYDGHKTAAFLTFSDPALSVVSCEPDLENFKQLSIRFRSKKVKVLNLALSRQNEVLDIYSNEVGSAFNTLNPKWVDILEKDNVARWNQKLKFDEKLSYKVNCVTLDFLIEKYGIPDFIKVDVEGFERNVIEGLNQGVPCITVECLLPEFKTDFFYN